MNRIFPRITIVTPSYNQGQFLEDTIKSVVGQSYPAFEYFVIDGGSEDNSVEILKRYEDYIDYWVSAKDRGQSHAINKGFTRASGDFISWLNSDDMLLPAALGHIAEYVQTHPRVDVIMGGLLIGQADGTVSDCFVPPPAYSWCAKRGIFDLFQPSTFIRRTTLLQVGLLREDLHCRMDADLLTRLAEQGSVWGYISRPLSFLRRHPGCKGNAWEEQYQAERDLLQSESPYAEWQAKLAMIVRKIHKGFRGIYFKNWLATRSYRGQTMSEIWEESEK